MTRALLDVNVLIALLDSEHLHHERARAWFVDQGSTAWASCAITQNGFVRVVSQSRYSNPRTVPDASARLRSACSTARHEFWNCDYSIFDGDIAMGELLGSRAVTDVYLLGLAVRHGGRLVTFDRSIQLDAVSAATPESLVVL